MKILLTEADGALAGRLFHLLVKNGYQTTAVKTGQAALDEIGRSYFDMVIAEACPPAVDGCALVPVKKPVRKCKKNRAAGELEGARPASNEILRSACPQSPRRALGTS